MNYQANKPLIKSTDQEQQKEQDQQEQQELEEKGIG
jgi:hypothetical protein